MLSQYHAASADIMALQTGLLEDAGVALISGTSFGDEGEGFLRFSCANSDEAIGTALDRIKDWLSQHR